MWARALSKRHHVPGYHWEEMVKLMNDNGADPKVEDVLNIWELDCPEWKDCKIRFPSTAERKARLREKEAPRMRQKARKLRGAT